MSQALAQFDTRPEPARLGYPAGHLALGVSVYADRAHLRDQMAEDAAAAGFRLGAHGPVRDLLADDPAGLGEVVQAGATGGVVSMTYATGAVVINPPGVATDAVGLAATEVGLVDVHTTLPPVLGAGTQVDPGIVAVLPLPTLVQVITVFTV